MSNENIIKLFYDDHLSVTEISKKTETSLPYISKVVKKDSRYKQEKEDRKNTSKTKKKIAHNKLIKTQREQKRIDDNYSFVKIQHIQAVIELSDSKRLTNETYRRWNSSCYKYNSSKKRYEFDESLGRSYAVPKYIKER